MLELAVAKLASSGLTPADAQALGLSVTPSALLLDAQFKPLPALVLPYRHPLTAAPLTPAPGWPPFYRLRYLKEDTSFAAQAAARSLRYTQPTGTGVRAFFPLGLSVAWPAVLADPTLPLAITEGELKAAAAARHGFATIGLGGVSSFTNKTFGEPFLAELEAVTWLRRRVPIIYDSDFRSNPQVCRAVHALAEELQRRGALPLMVTLPELPALAEQQRKTGLDDYLLAAGPDALEALIAQAPHLGLARDLWALNETVAYVADPGALVVKATGRLQSPAQFSTSAPSTRLYLERRLTPRGELVDEPVALTAAWLRWPLRHEVAHLTYRPGGPQLIESPPPLPPAFNTWPGWGVTPQKGSVALWTQLIDHLFAGAEPAAKQWFLQWCAFPLQWPGTKLFAAVVLHGIKHGTGKSQVGYSLGRLYGRNFSEITQADLHSSFNEWAVNKQFILADDITGSGADKREDADRLKKLVTQKTITINAKFLPTYTLPDCINYLFTSNHIDALFMDDDDRRYFVHEVTTSAMDETFYLDYEAWLSSAPGAGALLHHLLYDIDTSSFNPSGRAFRTQAKARMQADALTDVGTWVRTLRDAPATILRVGQVPIQGDLLTAKQLLTLYDPAHEHRVTANGLTRELRRAGFPLVLGGLPVHHNHVTDRYFAVRNFDRWTLASEAQVLAHLRTAK